jgi:hypothetical protein
MPMLWDVYSRPGSSFGEEKRKNKPMPHDHEVLRGMLLISPIH